MIQIRLAQQALAQDMASMKNTQTENHAQNRGSIHDLREDLQTVTDNISEIGTKIDNYLLVQSTLAEQRSKAWWKQPLGTALIVAIITVGWSAIKHGLGWQ